MARALKCKPLNVLLAEEETGQLPRTLGLFDLVAIGVGGTVGSGVFSVVGQVAANDCGPGITVALLLGATGCVLTGNSYVKLSRAIPSTGSVYAYSYHCLGEVFAILAGFCLTLEYSVSAYGIAYNWGKKVAGEFNAPWLGNLTGEAFPVNLAGGFICLFCSVLCLFGSNVGKGFTNVVTIAKVALVIFMIAMSLYFFQASNLTPLIPAQECTGGVCKFGLDGLFQGVVSSFFAFIGFDEVCCLAGEAKDPSRDIPRAVTLSVIGVAILTFMAGFSLVGMEPYKLIDSDAGFKVAFDDHGAHWAAEITSWGEILTLPVVIFVGILPQARLFYAMAKDGLLPLLFARLRNGVLLAGNLVLLVYGLMQALFLDFGLVADLTGAGVLLSWILCNASLIMLTLGQDDAPGHRSTFSIGASAVVASTPAPTAESRASRRWVAMILSTFIGCSFVCLVLAAGLALPSTVLGKLHTAQDGVRIAALIVAVLAFLVASASFALLARRPHSKEHGSIWIPSAGTVFNCFMLSTCKWTTFIQFAVLFVLVLAFYFSYGINHSAGRDGRWQRQSLMSGYDSADKANGTVASEDKPHNDA